MGRRDRRRLVSGLMARLGARVPARRILGLHPGAILAVLDTIGLAIASYLSIVELSGGVPVCPAEGVGSGCAAVALSEYSKIGGLPVAVYGVGLSLILLTLVPAALATQAVTREQAVVKALEANRNLYHSNKATAPEGAGARVMSPKQKRHRERREQQGFDRQARERTEGRLLAHQAFHRQHIALHAKPHHNARGCR